LWEDMEIHQDRPEDGVYVESGQSRGAQGAATKKKEDRRIIS